MHHGLKKNALKKRNKFLMKDDHLRPFSNHAGYSMIIRFLQSKREKNLIEDIHAYFSTQIFTQIVVLEIKFVK